MPPVGFEPTISAGEQPQTYALNRAATGTGSDLILSLKYLKQLWFMFSFGTDLHHTVHIVILSP